MRSLRRTAPALCAALASLSFAVSASAELLQEAGIRVSLSASLRPKRLPRHGAAPVSVAIGGHISSIDKASPAKLVAVSFAFNRAGKLDLRGIPRCRQGHIDPSTTEEALKACGRSLVGEGHFSANVRFPEQSPFPSEGKVLAFNGVLKGRPVIFAHVYGPEPVPTSYVLALEIRRARGAFGTVMHASLPQATGEWGYVTGLSLRLGGGFAAHGQNSGFLEAGCPAPPGFPGAIFPLLKTSFAFTEGIALSATLNRSCEARG